MQDYIQQGHIEMSNNILPERQSMGELLKKRMEDLKITQVALASKMNLTQGQIGHYVTGSRGIPIQRRKTLERLLDLPAGTLTYSEENIKNEEKKVWQTSEQIKLYKNIHFLPILEVYEVAQWAKYGNLPSLEKKTEVIVLGKNLSEKCFLMPVVGDSMASGNKSLSFYDGEYIVVDPDRVAKPGHIVVALVGNEDVKIRQYQQDGTQFFLKSFDQQYPLIQVTKDVSIVGVVIQRMGTVPHDD